MLTFLFYLFLYFICGVLSLAAAVFLSKRSEEWKFFIHLEEPHLIVFFWFLFWACVFMEFAFPILVRKFNWLAAPFVGWLERLADKFTKSK